MKIRLTEIQMVDLIKKSLQEQTMFYDNPLTRYGKDRQQKINVAWCSVKDGVVQNQLPLKVMWCGKGGYQEKMNISYEEISIAEKNCSKKIWSTPALTNTKEGFFKVYEYYRAKSGGSSLKVNMSQDPCGDHYFFEGINKDGSVTYFYNHGKIFHSSRSDGRNLSGTWGWDGNKPVLNLPLTKTAVGYAQTEEDITDNKKILYIGSKNDLVKRVQYEILSYSRGEENSGCKKGADGKFKPSLCDGVFGPKTKRGVQYFQKNERLKDKTGIVGAETWDAMDPYSIDSEGMTQEEIES
jgi:hypothetical protein